MIAEDDRLEALETPEDRSRVSKRKKYLDLIERARRNSRIEEDIELFPIVRKSVASFRIAELSSPLDDAKFVGLSGDVPQKDRIPSEFLDATPTQLNEISDNWILDRIAHDIALEIPIRRKERAKNTILKFVKRFGKKYVKKRIGNDAHDEPEILPNREFEELREKFSLESKKFVNWEPDVAVNESIIVSHDLGEESMGISMVRPSKSTSVGSLDPTKQSSFSMNLSSNLSVSDEISRRFRISHVLSDFSLQKRILILDT